MFQSKAVLMTQDTPYIAKISSRNADNWRDVAPDVGCVTYVAIVLCALRFHQIRWFRVTE